MNSKTEIRKLMITKRSRYPMEQLTQKSTVICDKIINNPIYQQAKVIYLYSSIRNEVCVDSIINHAIKRKKIVALPKVEGKNIFFYVISSVKDLKEGAFGIFEPFTNIKAPNADLIIVPGVAFDKNGMRLGYGGGFYDRYLSDNKVYSIGVAYDFQLLDTIPAQKHDIVLNEIISD